MKFNRTTTSTTTAAIAGLIAVIALVIGFFVIAGRGAGADDPDTTVAPAAANEQSLTVSARDTSKRALSGVAVRLLGADGTTVTSGTTGSSGEASLTFTPKAGTYVVVADEPTGYHARDDKDGGATQVGGPPCDNSYLCIYLTVTEVRNADGTTSFTVELTHVTSDQRSDLDDLWFEMTPPAAATEEETAIAVDEPDEETLIGDPVEETIDQATDESDENNDPDTAVDEPEQLGLGSICADVRHQPVDDQKSKSGIWVRGEVYGLDGGWIWVEGPTINGGEPVRIPVEGGAFEGPLGISSYGDHEIVGFELQGDDSSVPTDLLPTLAEGPGTVFPVGPEEGSVFDSECFEFAPPTAVPVLPIDEQAAAEAEVDEFLIRFVDDHTTGNVDDLLATLHPAVPLAFGESICSDYVARTVGSIVGAETVSVGLPVELDLDTPNGVVTFPEAIPFTVEFTLTDGSTVTNEANLALHDGEAHWLTRCGVD